MKNSSDLADRALDNLRRTLYARLEAADDPGEQLLCEGTLHHLERLRRERDEAWETAQRGLNQGLGVARGVLSLLANWSFNGTEREYPSNVLDIANGVLLDVAAGRVRISRRL